MVYKPQNNNANLLNNENTGSEDIKPLTDAQLSILTHMTKEQLIALVRLCNAEQIGIALLTEQEKAEAARLKLITIGLTAKEAHKVIPALDKWFDRTEGKAPQSISMDVRDDRMDKMPIDDLLWLAQQRKLIDVTPRE